jgi:ribosome assembly protein 1
VPAGSAAAAPAPSTDLLSLSAALPTHLHTLLSTLRSGILQGFQLASGAGPLCAEPMWGVCFVVEELRFVSAAAAGAAGAASPAPSVEPASTADSPSAAAPCASGAATLSASLAALPALSLSSGQTISLTRDACRVAFQAGTPRLVEPLYNCQLTCSGGRGGGTSGEQLGRLYAVLARRRGRVLAEDVWEGTQTFVISALLPVAESFGFADDLRKRTSGAATSPQLLFSHWEVLPVDPFFVPSTAEEREAYGDTVHEGQVKNIARLYVDAVRGRKGLPVERKIVAHAEKQRNLSRKK